MSKLSKTIKILKDIFSTSQAADKKDTLEKKIQDFLSECGQYDKDCYNQSIDKLKQLYPNMKEADIEDDRNEITKVISKVFYR